MYFQKVNNRFSFVYYDTKLKKNVRLNKFEHPNIQSEADAILYCKKWDAEHDAMKTRVRRKLEWSKKFFDFSRLLTIYENAKKEDAPNTWQDCSNNIKYYVFPYFLSLKNENNINNWSFHYEAFRSHLEKTESMKKKGLRKTLAYSTINHIINSLNGFVEVMYRWRFIERKDKCRHFPSSLLTQRSEDAVIDPKLQHLIYSSLRFRDERSADFFLVSLHTGMRLNELMGLSLRDFHCGEINSDFMKRALKPYRMIPYGYITLESQPKSRADLRTDKGEIERKPLKGKKSIDHEDCRIIPIFDKRAYNTIVKLWNLQRVSYEQNKYGYNLSDYLLFDGLKASTYYNNLIKVQQKLKISKLFTPHCTRHTYSTWLADRTGGNYTLCRMILGHTDVEMTMRYVHINSRIRRQMNSKEQLKSSIELAI